MVAINADGQGLGVMSLIFRRIKTLQGQKPLLPLNRSRGPYLSPASRSFTSLHQSSRRPSSFLRLSPESRKNVRVFRPLDWVTAIDPLLPPSSISGTTG